MITTAERLKWRTSFETLYERVRIGWPLAIRMIVASVAAFTVSKLLHLPEATWSVLTALIAARPHSIGTARAGVDRAIGTVGGAVIAIAAGFLHGHLPAPLVLLIVLAPACMLVAIDEKFRAAPMAGLIVISGGAIGGSPLVTAFYRTSEIMIGGVMAYLASLIIAPRHGDQKVEHRAAFVLLLLSRQALTSLRAPGAGQGDELRDQVRDALRELGVAAHSSRWSRSERGTDAMKLTRILSAVHADLNYIARSLDVRPVKDEWESNRAVVDEIAQAIAGVLERMATALRNGSATALVAPIDTALGPLEAASTGHLTFLLRSLRNDVARTSGLLAMRAAAN
jgi:uncharacterized membrane protein YccC